MFVIFNNILVILSLSVLLVEENGVPGENLLSLVTMVGVFDAIFNNIQLYHDGYTFINGGKQNTRENPTVLSVFTLTKLYQHMQARFGISKNLY